MCHVFACGRHPPFPTVQTASPLSEASACKSGGIQAGGICCGPLWYAKPAASVADPLQYAKPTTSVTEPFTHMEKFKMLVFFIFSAQKHTFCPLNYDSCAIFLKLAHYEQPKPVNSCFFTCFYLDPVWLSRSIIQNV